MKKYPNILRIRMEYTLPYDVIYSLSKYLYDQDYINYCSIYGLKLKKNQFTIIFLQDNLFDEELTEIIEDTDFKMSQITDIFHKYGDFNHIKKRSEKIKKILKVKFDLKLNLS